MGAGATPLKGIKVVELARILAGPWAGQVLADLGCEVIKVESPSGDDTRRWGPPFVSRAGTSDDAAYFHACNRGKQSIVADFNDPEDLARVKALIADADVVIENFRVGGLARFGLDHASLKELHPRLVYCSITGFGQDGPYAGRAGYDFIIQGMSGFMSLTGEPDGEPQKIGVALADIVTGLYAVIGIQAAILERESTGGGANIDMSLLDSMVGVLANQAMNYLVSGTSPQRMGNAHPNIAPYQVFRTEDGHFVLAVGNDRQFSQFCQIIGLTSAAGDSRFVSNRRRVEHREALAEMIEAETIKHATASLLEQCEDAGVPAGPINTVDEVFRDPQVVARGLVLGRAEGRPGVRTPIVYDGRPAASARAAPTLGEHDEKM
ncbi:MAG: CaiB/BaiF CoA-transferase family protein [Pseudomonadota bacterium]